MNTENKNFLKVLSKMIPTPKLSNINVLMIDDESRNLSAFRAEFRRRVNVFLASNKIEALEAVNNNRIDYIFCDYLMPVNNGADILNEIKLLFPNIKSTIVTAYRTKKMMLDFKDKTVVLDILDKPCDVVDLSKRIFGGKI